MKLEFSRELSKKLLNVNFYENLFSVSRFVPWGRTDSRQTDRQEESNSRFSQFRGTRLKFHVEPKNALFHNLCLLSSM